MQLIKKTRLAFQQGSADKVYEVDLVELSSREHARFLVNFRYGRRGNKLREGTKTPAPVTDDDAQAIFDSVVIAKLNKGYVDSDQPQRSTPQTSALDTSIIDDQQKHHALIETYTHKLGKELASKQRARIIWRLAELGATDTVALMLNQLGQGEWIEDYSIAWAIGRLHAYEHYPALDKLSQSNNANVQKIAYEAQLLLAQKQAQPQLLKSLQQQCAQHIPGEIILECKTGTGLTLYASIKTAVRDSNKDHNALLIALYQYSHTCLALRQGLLKYLREIPLQPNYFKAVRALIKTAEMRLDARVFALLNTRIENQTYYYFNSYGSTTINGRYLNVKKELNKPNSRVAFSNKTRLYLRKRAWRTLQRLAMAKSSDYVELAYSLLLEISDEHAQASRSSEVYRYDNNWNRQLISTHHYDGFATFIAFNHIVRGNSPDYTLSKQGHIWLSAEQPPSAHSSERYERYPELWDKAPEKLLALMQLSQCGLVHNFAANALRDAELFNQTISPKDLTELLQSAYESTCNFAFTLIQQRMQTLGDKPEALVAFIAPLLHCKIDTARQLGLSCLAKLPERTMSAELISQCLMAPFSDVQDELSALFKDFQLSRSRQADIVSALIHAIEAIKSKTGIVDAVLTDTHDDYLCQFISVKLADAAKYCELNIIESLVNKADATSQRLGASLLLLNRVVFADIPSTMLLAINQSKYDAVRVLGIDLLGKQKDQVLAAQIDSLLLLYQSSATAERVAYLNIFARLSSNKAWSEKLSEQFIALSFKTLQHDKQHQEIEHFFSQHLANTAHSIDTNLIWRMLQSKAKLAQAIGALLICMRPVTQYSVKQWAILAKHASKKVRNYAHSAYKENIDLCISKKQDALLILDANWDDSREFAFDYFRQHFGQDEWDIDTIIFLCDSTREDVQTFGREVLQRFFDNNLGHIYLQKLSQHPSVNVQLFTSSLLHDYAANQPQRIIALEHYFTTVLAQVYRGRICKDRVIDFLLTQSRNSIDVASMCAKLFTHISLTIVHKDKSQLIKAMLELKSIHPQLELPIAVIQPAIKASV